MPELHLPFLEISILLPVIGAILISFLRNQEVARRTCLIVSTLTLLCATGEWLDFAMLHTFEAHDHWDLLEFFFHKDFFVIDELSAPLLPLTALLYLMTALSTLRTKVNRFSFRWMLVSEAILLATLSCKEPWGIIALLSVATIPPWLEIRSRNRSTRVFTIHMGLFVLLLVAGQTLIETHLIGSQTTIIAGALLTMAALLRSGIVPLHCWITDLFEKATFGTALLFVTPMTGAYAVMRLVLPIAPDWAMQSIAVVSLVTAVYAGGMALVQHEARRFFCYLFLSHSSLVLVGLELVTPIGLTGALCVWLSVTLSLAAFGLTLRCVEARIGRVSLDKFGGLYEQMPTLAAFFLLTGLASIGFPGTVGFIGIELLVEGAVTIYPLIGTAVVVAAALNGIAVLHAYFRVFTGAEHSASISLHARLPERIAVLILTLLIIGGGLYPQPGVSSRYHAATELIRLRHGDAQSAPSHQTQTNHKPYNFFHLTENK
ncbi:NADH-ubiquinone oxidoreductase chain M [hydrothermal vent metagenome]|uniref:NADH-ubiquinone oxidoreductase chain M n=1 Tax=hydrothermal vent metagenome TaxID=652676 RepID=A0A3B1E6L2_9ZZZZ